MSNNKNNKKPGEKKKIDILTIVVCLVIVIFLLYLATGLGAAMDLSVGKDGKVVFNELSDNLTSVLASPTTVFKGLQAGGYAPQMLFFAVVAIAIFALYKYAQIKRRLHRKGVEHGSAHWGDEKEMCSLKDNGKDPNFPHKEPQFKPLLTSDGKRVFDKSGEFVGVLVDNNIILTEQVYMSLNSRQHLMNLNVLIIGGSGSGKTRFYAKPNILQLNSSYVITDPKGEILQAVGGLLAQAGYELKVFNTIEMAHSHNYNPFHYVYDYNGNLSEDNVTKMIDVFMQNTKGEGEKDDFWSQSATKLTTAIVFLLFEESEYNSTFINGESVGVKNWEQLLKKRVEEPDKVKGFVPKIEPSTRNLSHLNFFSVTEKMRRLQYPPQGSEDGYFMTKGEETDEEFQTRRNAAFLCPLDKDFIELERRKKDSLAIRLYQEARKAAEETGQSILATAGARTQMFNLTAVSDLTCCDNIKLETLGDKKSALFIIISATNATYNFLAAMMYTQMFDVLANRANFKYKGSLKVPVRCIMDEFANIGQIPDFDKVIAFVRSMGMSLNVIIQNLAQLKARYEKTWEVITGNCDSMLFLGGKEASTLKDISEALGKETIDVESKNRTVTGGHKSDSTAESNSILGRELMTQDELQKMPISDCVLMIRSHNPFYCNKFPLEKHPNFKFTEDFDKALAFDKYSIKVKTLEQFAAENKHEKEENEKSEVTQNDSAKSKMNLLFSQDSEIEVEAEEFQFETYLEAIEFSDKNNEFEVGEEFVEKHYGEPVEPKSMDLGEPVSEFRKEVDDYGFAQLSESSVEDENDEFDKVHYNDDEQELCSFSELTEEIAESADVFQNEIHSSAIHALATDIDDFAG